MNREEVVIHPSAIVHPDVILGKGVHVGPYSIIEEGTIVGDNCNFMSHVIIRSGSIIGSKNQFYHGCVIGSEPQDLQFENEKSYVEIGEKNIFREYVTINRGSGKDSKTVIGNECYFLAYSHVGHNCLLKNYIVLTSYAGLSGHVHVHDNAWIGGLTGVHQFVTIHRSAMVAGLTRVNRDVPPFMLVSGQDQNIHGLNSVGLRRLNFSKELRSNLSKACKIMFHSKISLSTAIQMIQELPNSNEMDELLNYAKGIYNGRYGRARQP